MKEDCTKKEKTIQSSWNTDGCWLLLKGWVHRGTALVHWSNQCSFVLSVLLMTSIQNQCFFSFLLQFFLKFISYRVKISLKINLAQQTLFFSALCAIFQLHACIAAQSTCPTCPNVDMLLWPKTQQNLVCSH